MKLGSGKATPTPAAEPELPPADDLGSEPEQSPVQPPVEPEAGPAENPLEKQPFDAGVDADEDSDPKKYIEKLTGKLGQSLRTYNQNQGQPDFELEKFAVNSLLSATHTGEMDEQDQNDIIKKVKGSGGEDNEENDNSNPNNDDAPITSPSTGGNAGEGTSGGADGAIGGTSGGGAGGMFETEDLFLHNPKKNNMFQEGSNDILDEMKPCWKGYKQEGMKEKDGRKVPNCIPVKESKNNLINSKNSGIFVDIIKIKLTEMTETQPLVKPQVSPTKPKEQPVKKPSRRDAPFLPDVTPSVQPAPKAIKEGRKDYEVYHKTLAATLDEIRKYVIARGFDPIEFGTFDVEHVGYGTTRRIDKELSKNGIPLKNKHINAQVYRMDSGTYELNMYM